MSNQQALSPFMSVRRSVIVITAVVSLLTSHVSVAASPSSYKKFLHDYAGLLSSYLHPSQSMGIQYMGVDYKDWARDPRYPQARRELLSVNPALFSGRAKKMAFWINAYNFLTVDLVLRKGHGRGLKKLQWLFLSPWKEYTWRFAGKSYSLDDIEDNILRQTGDARVHFSINCGSVSCPDLRGEPYVAKKLDQQLNNQVLITLANHQKGMRIKGHTLYLTKIMDWDRNDFDGGNLQSWLRKFVPDIAQRSLHIEFMPYDWSLNKVRK